MKVYTNVKTMKKVWRLLKEVDIEGLLDGGKIEINPSKILNWLLEEDKLNMFCRLVTKTEEDFEEKDLDEVVKVVADFFGNIGEAFRKLTEEMNLGMNIEVNKKTPSGN